MKLGTAEHTVLVMALEAEIIRIEAQSQKTPAHPQRLPVLKKLYDALQKSPGSFKWEGSHEPFQIV